MSHLAMKAKRKLAQVVNSSNWKVHVEFKQGFYANQTYDSIGKRNFSCYHRFENQFSIASITHW